MPHLREDTRAWVGKGKTINESEMALFSECSLKCARKVLDTADIVREAILRQQSAQVTAMSSAFIDLIGNRGINRQAISLTNPPPRKLAHTPYYDKEGR